MDKMCVIEGREKFLHTLYCAGLVLGGFVLAASQWFDVYPIILRLTSGAFCFAIASSLIIRYTPFRGLGAVMLAPLAIALPIILSGSILYVANVPLTGIGISVIIGCLAGIGIACSRSLLQLPRPIFPRRLSLHPHTLISIGFAVSLSAAFASLFFSQTTKAILGPWQATNASFFIFYALATLFALWGILGKPQSRHLLVLFSYGILSASISLILFPIGFGFDPFIHEAAEAHIALYGFLEPKTFYYIGHYVLVIFLSKISAIGIPLIDRLIVPIGITAALVPIASLAMRTLWKDKSIAAYCIIMLFALPYPFLSISTPWSFAYGITALAVLSTIIALEYEKSARWCLPILIATALAVHPLAGIPVAFYGIFFFLWPGIERQKSIIKVFSIISVSLLGICAIPAAFIANSFLSAQLAMSFTLPQISIPSLLLFQSRFSLFLDPVYFYAYNLFFILFIAGIAGFFILRSQGKARGRLAAVGLISFFITLAHAFILTSVISFNSLISYERGDYGIRLVSLAFVFLLPHIIATVGSIASRVFGAACPPLARMAWVTFSMLILVASLYLSYPRNDAFQAFHGYNVSSADVSAVQWIHHDTGDARFAVLANQVVSSAAIRSFGFGASHFYYPLPTSSQLYQYYTRILQKPRRSIVEEVKKFIPVSRVYVVVPSYEPRAPLIINQLREQASRSMSFEDDAVTVVVFE